MRYGAKGLMWAPFAESDPEPAGKLPNYGKAISLGSLVELVDAPAFAEAKGYGDDELKCFVSEFKECPLTIKVTSLPRASAGAVFGSKLEGPGETESAGEMTYNSDDHAPYGGLAFYIKEQLDDNQTAYMGIFFPKVKATPGGNTYTTKGDSITLTAHGLSMLASAAKNGDWKKESDYFDTEAEAIAWRDKKLASSVGP